jgi:hypothetical protein
LPKLFLFIFSKFGIFFVNLNDLHSVIQQVADLTLRKKSKNKRKKTQIEKWFDQDLHKKKKQVKDKGFLMSKYPHDPLIRGSFFKINKEYAKLRKYKKKQFRQQIIFDFFLKVRSATCWITECRWFVALLISEVVKFISSFKKLSSLFLIFGFKNPFVKSSELLSFHMYLFRKSFSFLLIISL